MHFTTKDRALGTKNTTGLSHRQALTDTLVFLSQHQIVSGVKLHSFITFP